MNATIRPTCTSIFSAVFLLALLSSSVLVRGATPLPEPPPQSRPLARVNGDVNGDGVLDLSDPVRFLSWRFLGGAEPALLGCEVLRGQNGDVNGDGALEISDAIYLLGYLFGGGPAPVCGCGEPVSRDPNHDDEDDSSSLRFLDNQSAVQEVDPIPQHLVLRGRPQPVYSVRIHAIRTANTDGTQAATITPAQIKLLVDQANVVYYSAGIEFQFDGEPALDPEVEEALFRIAQEALNNMLKHAQAHRVVVSLSQDEQAVTLEIADDGAGFEPATARRSGGMGLRGMEERAAEIGARLEIESAAGCGTRVRVVWEREDR